MSDAIWYYLGLVGMQLLSRWSTRKKPEIENFPRVAVDLESQARITQNCRGDTTENRIMTSLDEYAAIPGGLTKLPRLNLNAISPLKEVSRQAILTLRGYHRKRDNLPMIRRAAVVCLLRFLMISHVHTLYGQLVALFVGREGDVCSSFDFVYQSESPS